LALLFIGCVICIVTALAKRILEGQNLFRKHQSYNPHGTKHSSSSKNKPSYKKSLFYLGLFKMHLLNKNLVCSLSSKSSKNCHGMHIVSNWLFKSLCFCEVCQVQWFAINFKMWVYNL